MADSDPAPLRSTLPLQAISVLTAFLINNYNPKSTHPRAPKTPIEHWLCSLHQKFKHPEHAQSFCAAITSPPPLLFFIACLAFALSLVRFHNLHRNDKYQDWIIVLGLLASLVATFFEPAEKDWGEKIQGTLPLYLIVAINLSALGHMMYFDFKELYRVFYSKDENAQEETEETTEQETEHGSEKKSMQG